MLKPHSESSSYFQMEVWAIETTASALKTDQSCDGICRALHIGTHACTQNEDEAERDTPILWIAM